MLIHQTLRKWLMLLASLAVGLQPTQAQVDYFSNVLDVGPIYGDLVIIYDERAPGPIVPEIPLVVGGLDQFSGMIVQRAGFGGAWYGIEREVVEALLELHGIERNATERSRILRWERNLIRAALWNRISEILWKEPAARTALESEVVVEITKLFKAQRIACAQRSVDEYHRWDTDPAGFVPVPPFTYVKAAQNNTQNFYTLNGGPKPPSFEEFQAYGVLLHLQGIANNPEYATIAAETAQRNLLLNSMLASETLAVFGGAVAGTIVASGVSAAIGGALAAAGSLIVKQLVLKLFPYTVRLTSAVAGRAAVAGLGVVTAASVIFATVGIIVFAVVESVFEGIAVVEATELPGKLQQALARAQTEVIDLRSLTGAASATPTEAQTRVTQELFSVFLNSTIPDFPGTGLPAVALASDPQWLTNPIGSSLVEAAPTLRMLGYSGEQISVRLVDGWFAVREPPERRNSPSACPIVTPTG